MGKACTFFGHHDCQSSIKPKLREVLIHLIESHSVDMFYVGQQGIFDGIVRTVLKELVSIYPHICYAVASINYRQEPSEIKDFRGFLLESFKHYCDWVVFFISNSILPKYLPSTDVFFMCRLLPKGELYVTFL